MEDILHAKGGTDVDRLLTMRREIQQIARRIEHTLTAGHDERAVMTAYFLLVVSELQKRELRTITGHRRVTAKA